MVEGGEKNVIPVSKQDNLDSLYEYNQFWTSRVSTISTQTEPGDRAQSLRTGALSIETE